MVDGHEREGRIDLSIGDRDVEAVDRIDQVPVAHRSAAERVDRQRQPRAANGIHVDDIAQVVDVGKHQVALLGRFPAHCDLQRQPLHARIAVAQQRVGSILDPPGDVGVGRPAMGRVVLEAAVLRRIVRGRDHDAVGQPVMAPAVMDEDGVGDRRRRREAVVALDDGRHVVCRQNLERGPLRGTRDRVRVLAHVERAGDGVRVAIVADRLGDRHDVRRGERAAQGRSSVPAGPEADLLGGIVGIRPALQVVAFQPGEIDQQFLRGRLAGERRERHSVSV